MTFLLILQEEGIDFEFKVRPMRSAYIIKSGTEPEFTCYSHTKDDVSSGRPPFCGTLDYIFLSVLNILLEIFTRL